MCTHTHKRFYTLIGPKAYYSKCALDFFHLPPKILLPGFYIKFIFFCCREFSISVRKAVSIKLSIEEAKISNWYFIKRHINFRSPVKQTREGAKYNSSQGKWAQHEFWDKITSSGKLAIPLMVYAQIERPLKMHLI